jgi:hypothetical protein
MSTVSSREVASDDQVVEGLPERVQEALGELAGAAKEGLLALSVGVGLGVLAELMEAEVDEVVGPKGKRRLSLVRDSERLATPNRHASSSSQPGVSGTRAETLARRANGERARTPP